MKRPDSNFTFDRATSVYLAYCASRNLLPDQPNADLSVQTRSGWFLRNSAGAAFFVTPRGVAEIVEARLS